MSTWPQNLRFRRIKRLKDGISAVWKKSIPQLRFIMSNVIMIVQCLLVVIKNSRCIFVNSIFQISIFQIQKTCILFSSLFFLHICILPFHVMCCFFSFAAGSAQASHERRPHAADLPTKSRVGQRVPRSRRWGACFFLVPTFVPGRVHRVHIHIIYVYIYTHRYHIRIFTCVCIAWITRPKDQCRYIDSQM